MGHLQEYGMDSSNTVVFPPLTCIFVHCLLLLGKFEHAVAVQDHNLLGMGSNLPMNESDNVHLEKTGLNSLNLTYETHAKKWST